MPRVSRLALLPWALALLPWALARLPWALALLVWALALFGCATEPVYVDGQPPDEFQLDHEPAVEQIPRLESPAELIGARVNHLTRTMYLSYRTGDRVFHARVTERASEDLSVDMNWTDVYLLEPVAQPSVPEQSREVDLLPLSVWREYVARLEQDIAPSEPGRAVLLNFRDRERLIVRGQTGIEVFDDIYAMPDGVLLTGSSRVEEMEDELVRVYEEFARERGFERRFSLAATGEIGPYARPFVVFDRQDDQVYFLSLEAFTFGSMPNNYAATTGRFTWHFVRSYYLEFFNRPVTYVSRLFYLVTDYLRDNLRGVRIRTFQFPDLANQPIPELSQGPPMDSAAWEAQLDRMMPSSGSQGEVELLINGDQYFPRLVNAIQDAAESVKVRTYIFDRDDFARRFADFLKERSRTVEVDVIVDGLGTGMAERKGAGTLPEDAEVPASIVRYLRRDSEVRVRNLTNPWLTGDHVKTTIIDGETAFVGGMNIGREYRWEWHDVMMRVHGPLVERIVFEFDKTWSHSAVLGDLWLAGTTLGGPEHSQPARGYPVRVLTTKPRSSQIFRAQKAAIRNARKRIFVENAYFSDTTILYELVRARLRGVDVRVILSLDGNHGIMNRNNVVAANTLLRYGARAYAYPGMSHVKAAVYDDWACLGSANFDKLSLRVNKELNLASSDPRFTGQVLAQVFEPDFAHAAEITAPLPENWSNRFASIVAAQL